MKSPDKPLLTESDKKRYNENPFTLWQWKASPGACDECMARNGQKYSYHDIPKRPHPNCKCTVEPLPDTTIQTAPPEAAFTHERTVGGVVSEVYHDTAEALREIARSKLWSEAVDNSYEAAKEIVNSEGWGDMATGTHHAIREVRSHPVAGPVLDSAIALEALAFGYVAAPLVSGGISIAEGAIASSAPILPDAVDFVTGMLPGAPDNEMQTLGDLTKRSLKQLEKTRKQLERGQIHYNPEEYWDAI